MDAATHSNGLRLGTGREEGFREREREREAEGKGDRERDAKGEREIRRGKYLPRIHI